VAWLFFHGGGGFPGLGAEDCIDLDGWNFACPEEETTWVFLCRFASAFSRFSSIRFLCSSVNPPADAMLRIPSD
jgi:hypothetical protein